MSAQKKIVPFQEGFLDRLPDSMIEEILLRLPLSSVFRSRCVSKRWLSITTHPHFIGRRELHHAPFRHDPPLALLLQNFYSIDRIDSFLCSGDPEVNLSGFSLDFLPGFSLDRQGLITVVDSCGDLLLCCNTQVFRRAYFVVNPITRQWHALPPTRSLTWSVLEGFVCEPTSVARARKGGELRYRVVRVPIVFESDVKIIVQIFSSENWQWKEYAMISPEGLLNPETWRPRSVACNGIMYWEIDAVEVRVMGLDPFNPKEKGISMIQSMPNELDMAPAENHELSQSGYTILLGMCRDKLKISEMIWFGETGDVTLCLKIWELENVEAKLRLVKELPFLEILAANPWIVRLGPGDLFSWRTLAFHPSNEDIIYLEWTNKIICCNLKMMTLEIASDRDLDERFCGFAFAFPFELPCWPTPIPTLP